MAEHQRCSAHQPIITSLCSLLGRVTIKVQSMIENYFQNRVVGDCRTFLAPLAFAIIRSVPEILFATNLQFCFLNLFHNTFGTMIHYLFFILQCCSHASVAAIRLHVVSRHSSGDELALHVDNRRAQWAMNFSVLTPYGGLITQSEGRYADSGQNTAVRTHIELLSRRMGPVWTSVFTSLWPQNVLCLPSRVEEQLTLNSKWARSIAPMNI